ncbi:DoxX family protein [Sinomicrobium oceani]|nr:hypothetical protein [Sinomicrobium oceani]
MPIPYSGRLAMACMLVLTGTGHFLFTEGMMLMLPEYIPARKAIVLFTGIFEFAAALMLLIPKYRVVTGWVLIVFFVLALPCNIYAAIHNADLHTATYDGAGLPYLWFRIPLQLFFIAWVCLFILKKNT